LAVVFCGRFSGVGLISDPHAASDRGIPAGGEPVSEDGTVEK
jgi:hypothetical protein